jgi:hypothetical protein
MKKKLRELAKEPQFIEGIYNYCDNWCERCRFTSRCLSYASTAELLKEADETGDDLNRSLEAVASVFAETRERLLEMAEERGIELNSPEAEAAWQWHCQDCPDRHGSLAARVAAAAASAA